MQIFAHKTDVIHRLKKELLVLQGYKKPSPEKRVYTGLSAIERSFPQKIFPTGTIHDFLSNTSSNSTATNGFIAGLLSKLASPLSCRKGVGGLSAVADKVIWVNGTNIFPPALKLFGVNPENIIFINTRKPKEALWVVEEALKCESLVAVVGEIQELNFTQSQRLQLTVEKSGVTGFIHRHNPKGSNPIASAANWKITSAASISDGMPGVSFARWNVELVKVRNGRPGQWLVEWNNGHFKQIKNQLSIVQEYQTRNVS